MIQTNLDTFLPRYAQRADKLTRCVRTARRHPRRRQTHLTRSRDGRVALDTFDRDGWQAALALSALVDIRGRF